MTVNNNPAGRLHTLLQLGKVKEGNRQIGDVWSEILNVPNQDNSLLLRRLGQVMTLPSSIKQAMAFVEGVDHNIYLRWLSAVEAAFKELNFNHGWSRFINQINGEVMLGIEICSDQLSRFRPEKTIDENQLEELLKKVNDLLAQLESTDLKPDSWFFIYDNLTRVKEAIETYKIMGIKPLEVVVEQTIGEVNLNPEKYYESKTADGGKGFWEIMVRLLLLIDITAQSIQIGKEVVPLIELQDSPTTELRDITPKQIGNVTESEPTESE